MITCSDSKLPGTVSCPPHQNTIIPTTMGRPQRTQSPSREGKIDLALKSLQSNPCQSVRKLTTLYDVPQSTLRTRRNGTLPRNARPSVNLKLSSHEEQSLVQWILDLDRRGFPPQIIDVRRMAEALLRARGQNPPPPPLGQKWVSRFVKRQSELACTGHTRRVRHS
jgi:hypothetical protein